MANEVKMRKANRIITIPEDQKDTYKMSGYDVIDNKGNVKEEATGGKKFDAGEVNKIQAENRMLKRKLEQNMTGDKNDEVAALESRIADLEKENGELNAELDKAKEAFGKAKEKIQRLESSNKQQGK